MTGLFPDLPLAHKFKEQTLTFAEFLESHTEFAPPTFRRRAVVHGHCHHKAIMRMKDERSLYEKMNLEHKHLESGCCGMAGSFGFEKDKYNVSVNIGERVLLPAVRRAEPSTLLIADGFSCREQISQLTDRHALHTAEVLSLAMHNPSVDSQEFPERQFIGPRREKEKKSMRRAALGVAGAVALALGLFFLKRRQDSKSG
jgi:Fe-S oxidoreductase